MSAMGNLAYVSVNEAHRVSSICSSKDDEKNREAEIKQCSVFGEHLENEGKGRERGTPQVANLRVGAPKK